MVNYRLKHIIFWREKEEKKVYNNFIRDMSRFIDIIVLF